MLSWATLLQVAAVGTATAVAFSPQQPLCGSTRRKTGICLAQHVAKSRASPCPLRMAGGEKGGMSDADLQGLLARVSAVKDRVQTLPLCVLDATLPLQRLEFATDDTSFQALLAGCKQRAGGSDLGTFGMLGTRAMSIPLPCTPLVHGRTTPLPALMRYPPIGLIWVS